MSKRALFSMLVVVLALGFGLTGCSDDDDDNGGNDVTGPITADVELTCIECHTNEEALRATVEEDDGHGEGEAEGEG